MVVCFYLRSVFLLITSQATDNEGDFGVCELTVKPLRLFGRQEIRVYSLGI
jgi:hypothetical protein